jgi:hypothetical protein
MNWLNSFSGEAHQVFMLSESWSSSNDVERHAKAEHTQAFNAALLEQKLLVCEPSLSLFGPPLTLLQLKSLGADANEDETKDTDTAPRRTRSTPGLSKTAPANTGVRRGSGRTGPQGQRASSREGSSRPPSGRSGDARAPATEAVPEQRSAVAVAG